jgi:hypothetical protein
MWKPWQRFIIGITEVIDGFSSILTFGFYHSTLSYYVMSFFVNKNDDFYIDGSDIEVKEENET